MSYFGTTPKDDNDADGGFARVTRSNIYLDHDGNDVGDTCALAKHDDQRLTGADHGPPVSNEDESEAGHEHIGNACDRSP